MSIKDILAQLDAVLDKIDDARALVNTAAELIDDAMMLMADVMAGSSANDTVQALVWFDEARQTMHSPLAPLSVADTAVKAYRANLVGDGTPGLRRDQPRKPDTPAAKPEPQPVTAERIDHLRRELPPPVVRATGQKTHGRWIDPDGTAQPMTSGWDDLSRLVNEELKHQGCPRLPARAAADVELKLAALMREKGRTDPRMRHITVVINNRPCKGDLSCDELVPVILPEGYSLTVHAPNYRKRFTGGAKPWWR